MNLKEYVDLFENYDRRIDKYTRDWLRKYKELSNMKKLLDHFDEPETEDLSWVINLNNTTEDKDPNYPWVHRWEDYKKKTADNHKCMAAGCNNILDPESKDNNGGHVFVLSKKSKYYARICIVPICTDHNSRDKAYQVPDDLLADKESLEKLK